MTHLTLGLQDLLHIHLGEGCLQGVNRGSHFSLGHQLEQVAAQDHAVETYLTMNHRLAGVSTPIFIQYCIGLFHIPFLLL